MRYSLKNLNQLLLKMQSTHFERYKNYTAADILIELLTFEKIADYWEIEWTAFQDEIYEADNSILSGTITKCKLDTFLKPIISRDEKVRILTFLRDNAEEVLFEKDYYENALWFRSCCAQLISNEIEQSRYDQTYGEVAEMPRPNLQAIANALPLPELCKEHQIIADNLPSYPHDLKLFHPSIIVHVASEFTMNFINQANVYNRTKENSDKPCMAIKDYKAPIRNRIIHYANRYLYFDEGPIYQTLWAICLMLRRIPSPNWWEKHCAEQILTYLSFTKFFSKSKLQMDSTIALLKQHNEPTLGFEEDIVIPKTTAPVRPPAVDNSALITQLADLLQNQDGRTNITFIQHTDKVDFNNPVDFVNINSPK